MNSRNMRNGRKANPSIIAHDRKLKIKGERLYWSVRQGVKFSHQWSWWKRACWGSVDGAPNTIIGNRPKVTMIGMTTHRMQAFVAPEFCPYTSSLSIAVSPFLPLATPSSPPWFLSFPASAPACFLPWSLASGRNYRMHPVDSRFNGLTYSFAIFRCMRTPNLQVRQTKDAWPN